MTITQERFNEKMDELDRQNPLPAYAHALREAGWVVEEPPVTAAEKLSWEHRKYFDEWKAAQLARPRPVTP